MCRPDGRHVLNNQGTDDYVLTNKANSFLKILCIITTSALATPNTNKTPVYYRFQQYTGTFFNRYLAVIGTYLLID